MAGVRSRQAADHDASSCALDGVGDVGPGAAVISSGIDGGGSTSATGLAGDAAPGGTEAVTGIDECPT